ncbi:MAG: PAS domain-containing protein, partial [Candidatus Omnitrophota bacterium]
MRQYEEYFKVFFIIVFLIGACFLTYYFHVIKGVVVVFTHLFYIPIILASLWWQKRGIGIAIFLGSIIVLSHYLFLKEIAISDDVLRALMFVAVAIAVNVLGKYRMMVEHLPVVTYRAAFDKPYSRLYISPQIKEFLGYSIKEYKDDVNFWHKRIHPDDRSFVLEEIEESKAGNKPLILTYRMIAKNGRVVWIKDEAMIVMDKAKKPLFFQGIISDITEQKREERLRENAVRDISHEIKTPIAITEMAYNMCERA